MCATYYCFFPGDYFKIKTKKSLIRCLLYGRRPGTSCRATRRCAASVSAARPSRPRRGSSNPSSVSPRYALLGFCVSLSKKQKKNIYPFFLFLSLAKTNVPGEQAHARLRLSPTVDEEDVAEAMRLVQTALRQTATDPRTGVIDMDVITTGTSRAARSLLGSLV